MIKAMLLIGLFVATTSTSLAIQLSPTGNSILCIGPDLSSNGVLFTVNHIYPFEVSEIAVTGPTWELKSQKPGVSGASNQFKSTHVGQNTNYQVADMIRNTVYTLRFSTHSSAGEISRRIYDREKVHVKLMIMRGNEQAYEVPCRVVEDPMLSLFRGPR